MSHKNVGIYFLHGKPPFSRLSFEVSTPRRAVANPTDKANPTAILARMRPAPIGSQLNCVGWIGYLSAFVATAGVSGWIDRRSESLLAAKLSWFSVKWRVAVLR